MKHGGKLGLMFLMLAFAVGACGDDDDVPSPRDGGSDAATDAGKDSGQDSGSDDDAGSAAAEVARGKYLVDHIAVCGDCHTPRKPDGSPDQSKLLSGVDCFIDADPTNADFGCLSARNLTHHATGLKNRSDEEIKNMFLKGERPVGSGDEPTALHPIMPYWVLGNMSEADADAIVAYLRTVPGVDHRVTAPQAPFLVTEPAPRFPAAKIPEPAAGYADREAALRGRYLAGNIGICMECHTERNEMGMPLIDKAFQGGEAFMRDALGLPPIFPATIYSANITPHATGIEGWSVADIVAALKQGEDKDQGGAPLCPPMPSGPMGAFGGMTDADARDIAHYLLSIPPGDNMIPADCMANVGGAEDAGAGDGG